jgi:hypothetical protein
MKSANAQNTITASFSERYTQNAAGYYVRNTNPAPATISDNRITETVKALLEKDRSVNPPDNARD